MAGGRLLKLASGALFGAGIGTALAILYAPQSGQELQNKLKALWHQAKLAGVEAQAQTELTLIQRYRELTGNEDSFRNLENEAKQRRDLFLSQLAAEHAATTAEISTITTPVVTTPTEVHA